MGRSTFGSELRRRRQLAGLSLAQLAVLIHYSKGYLSKIESGDKSANLTLAKLCDAALAADGTLIALVTEATITRPADDDDTDPDTGPWYLRLDSHGTTHFNRTDGTSFDGTTAFGPGPGIAGFAADPAVLSVLFSTRLDMAKTVGQMASPALVLPSLISETHLLRGLARNAGDEQSAGALWRLAAQFAEFTGWTMEDYGDDRQATWWTNYAVRLALRGGDSTMRAFALFRQADMAMYADDPIGTIDMARRAQADPTATARVRGLAAQREAQGHALLGDAKECFAALGRSTDLLAEAARMPSGALVLGATRTPDLNTLVRGWCLFELGRPAEAAELLESGIGGFAADAARARVRFGLRAALAQASSGEVDRACEIVTWLAADLTRVDSAMARHDIRRLARELRRQSGRTSAQDVLPLLADLLRAPSPAESA